MSDTCDTLEYEITSRSSRLLDLIFFLLVMPKRTRAEWTERETKELKKAILDGFITAARAKPKLTSNYSTSQIATKMRQIKEELSNNNISFPKRIYIILILFTNF